ncbi:TadE family protein [uncultured Photobacterium sp.]|uniref:TadE family protein n=1 Tax=uncultured Photobacterium sp. TaxID=173973 RepID=UPI002616BED8|nr:TadE family protein [uncultured Photobacterium sp.]
MKKQQGSVAVEAALGLPVLILVIFSWFDLCLMNYAMGVADHAITMAVSETKKAGKADGTVSANYVKKLVQALEDGGGVLWPTVIQKESVKGNIYYFRDYESLKSCSADNRSLDECRFASKRPKNMPIAIYQLSYNFKPMFNIYIPPVAVSREFIAIQEYERCKFKIGPGASCAS